MTAGVTVDGAAELARTLHRAASEVQDWTATNSAAGAEIAAAARRRAPRRSGALVNSISAQSDATAAQITARRVYAGVQEYGWPQHNIRAQPYMRPALAGSRDSVIGLYSKRLAGIVGRIMGA